MILGDAWDPSLVRDLPARPAVRYERCPQRGRSAHVAAASPARLAAGIKIPVLLIHGADDRVVPLSQSIAMQKALIRTGRKTGLVTLPDEGHSGREYSNERLALTSIGRFLWEHLGAGVGVSDAPPPLPAGE